MENVWVCFYMNYLNKVMELQFIDIGLTEKLMLGLEEVLLEKLLSRKAVMWVIKLIVIMVKKLD